MPAFLIKYQRRTGQVEYQEYESLIEATLQRLLMDKENDDPDLEIAAIASDSIENLRSSHSRYFAAEVFA